MGKTIVVSEIRQKDTKRGGVVHPGKVVDGAHAEVTPGESIRIHGLRYRTEAYDRTFRIGDEAEYHSYNLSYTGPIVAIGPSTVTVAEERGGRKVKRLSLDEFTWRNWNFDAAKTARRNAAEMQCL